MLRENRWPERGPKTRNKNVSSVYLFQKKLMDSPRPHYLDTRIREGLCVKNDSQSELLEGLKIEWGCFRGTEKLVGFESKF